VLIISLSLIGVISNYFFQKNSIKSQASQKIIDYKFRFDSYLDKESHEIESFLEFIKRDKEFQQLFINQNKKELFDKANLFYKNLNQNSDITHFYFLKNSGEVFLRVHDYHRDGDIVKRYTFIKAKEYNRLYSGIEFGVKKNYTLRVVVPWVVDGKIIGYIELGKEIDKIIKTLSKNLNIEIFFGVFKNNFKNQIEYVKNRLKNYNQSNNCFIVYETIKSNENIADLFNSKESNIFIDYGGNNYIVYRDELKDVSNKLLGEQLFLVNISRESEELLKSFFYYSLVMAFGTILMLLIGYLYANNKNKELDEVLFKLKQERVKVKIESEKKDKLLSLFNYSELVLFRWNNDESWSIDYVSKNVSSILGYSEDDFMNKKISYSQTIYSDDLNKVLKEVESAIDSNDFFFKHKPYRVVTKSGDIRWILDYTVLEKDRLGNITHFLGCIIDVTFQEKSRANLEKFIDTQDNIVILSNGVELHFANRKFFDFFGFDNLAQFKFNHNCICELFIKERGFFSLDMVKNDENWLSILKEFPQLKKIVMMSDKDSRKHTFSVSISEFDGKFSIISFSDISETISENIQLKNKTIHDNLTGAFNREFFDKYYVNIIKDCIDSGFNLGLAMIDIDYFKLVNDNYGHDVGDVVLKEFVNIIKNNSRKDDALIRWGGEEFVLLLKIRSSEDLQKALNHIREVIEHNTFSVIGKKTCSIGATLHNKERDIISSIKSADEALYIAKNSGRNRVVIN
jgi:diguanylate cyclase (GGDEF)-like protein/PAS domain S-box-containing protein